MTFFSWSTTKTKEGFTYKVLKMTSSDVKLSDGTYCSTEVIQSGTLPTRARAKTRAIKWVRYHKALAKKQA